MNNRLEDSYFEKVPFEQFFKDAGKVFHLDYDMFRKIYNNIKLPVRATSGSAGYDFFAPWSFSIGSDTPIVIPTGIRVRLDKGYYLQMTPRSGLGFKYGVGLANTIGIIDSDYYYADNYGHIMLKFKADPSYGSTVSILCGDGMAQGIILPYFITTDDAADGVRTGGFGSTTK